MEFSPFGDTFNMMFTVVPVLIALVFIFVFGVIIARAVQGARQWKRNNESAVLTVDATVVTKRLDVRYSRYGANDMHHTSSSKYYVTFEVESGDRMELVVRDTEYGILVERDKGRLTFQGTRYLGFERKH